MRHEKLSNIAQGISGITKIIQEDLRRDADANAQPFINQYHLGCLMSAIEELASQADEMAEEMAEEKEGVSCR
ncbi:hypothetical protein [Halomonas ventosae]|uniref:Rop-like protein n=1 Tax=Halomonas ventosae TaxID=229007 RepID=A0A2T0VL92_9GAMM|nr:hypothetical protein [Halomonas ventosae]PRY70993.1 hypothetical protein BCL64_11093 [Halomonas ventosae]